MIKNISICFIAKNEEKNIDKALRDLQKIICNEVEAGAIEILVLDTGSTDGTIEIAEKYGARVEHFKWINDFSAARNKAMRLAANDFILFLDADEFVEQLNLPKVFKLLNEYPDAIGRLIRRNLCNSSNGGTCIMTDRVERLFDRRLYHYEGCIHEQMTRNDGKGMAGYEIPLTVYHEGYMGTKEQLKAKAERNNVLLYKELENNPNDPYIYYQLGQSYSLCNEPEKELDAYLKGYLLNPDRNAEYSGMMISSLVRLLTDSEEAGKAIEIVEKEVTHFNVYADFLCCAGYAYMKAQEYEKSLNTYKKAFDAKLVHLDGSNTYIPAHNMGCIYEALGDELRAMECYEKASGYESSDIKREALSRESVHFYDKKVSVLLLIKSENENGAGSLLAELANQSIGMGHLEIIILMNDDVSNKVKESIHLFEKKYEASVILLEINTDEANDYSDELMYMDMLQYISTEKIIFASVNDHISFEAIRLLSGYMDATGAEVVCDNILYNNAGDFILEIADENMRMAVVQEGILRAGMKGKIYSRDLIMKAIAENIFSQNVSMQSIEACVAGRIYCLEETLID